MNERIKELAKQARQIGEYGNYGQIRLSPQQFEQKFAELIVRECIGIVEKNIPDECQQKEWPTDFLEGWENNSEVVIEDLMMHFGIEE